MRQVLLAPTSQLTPHDQRYANIDFVAIYFLCRRSALFPLFTPFPRFIPSIASIPSTPPLLPATRYVVSGLERQSLDYVSTGHTMLHICSSSSSLLGLLRIASHRMEMDVACDRQTSVTISNAATCTGRDHRVRPLPTTRRRIIASIHGDATGLRVRRPCRQHEREQ